MVEAGRAVCVTFGLLLRTALYSWPTQPIEGPKKAVTLPVESAVKSRGSRSVHENECTAEEERYAEGLR